MLGKHYDLFMRRKQWHGKPRSNPPHPPLRLRIPAGEARQRLAERIGKGKGLLELKVTSPGQLEQAQNEYYKWSAYNTELLKQLFSNESMAEEYSWFRGGLRHRRRKFSRKGRGVLF